MLIAIGSKNPVKIEAVKQAFNRVWPEEAWEAQGVDVPSGVSPQPMSDTESIAGATQRAKLAQQRLSADFGVGLEGGLQSIGTHWFDCGWIVVQDKSGTQGIGSTARVITPPKMIQMIQSGKELGEVIDEIFQTDNARQKQGHFGLMTNNAITRTSGYVDGVIMALVPFLHPELF